MSQIFLTRRNLLTLLSKLDRKKEGELTACTIIKRDNQHPKYPQTMKSISITAVEDEEYYIDRTPGLVHEKDERGVREYINEVSGMGHVMNVVRASGDTNNEKK